MKDLKEKVKSYLNKDMSEFVKKYKIVLTLSLTLVLLACVGIFVTYAYYQTTSTTPVVGGVVGKIPDLDVRIMAEDRDTNGNGLGTYSLYAYIPRAGYRYLPPTAASGDESLPKSYCVNGSEISYANYKVEVTAVGHDICYIYFKSTATLDLELDVYLQNVDQNGNPIENSYTKLETASVPSVGYGLKSASCEKGSEITYQDAINMFTINASEKDKCVAYMDAIDIDIAIRLFIQNYKGATTYYEADEIPHNFYYKLSDGTYGHESSCTGTDGVNVMTLEKQQLVIKSGSRTSCVAYLDIDEDNGPIIESMTVNPTTAESLTVNVTMSNAGTTATTYYFSKDGGLTYTSSSSNEITFTTTTSEMPEVVVYATDANGKSSAEVPASFFGIFTYSNARQEKEIKISGYYKLQVWGAQGGMYSTYAGGLGGYSSGIVYLNAGDTLYVYTGGMGALGVSGYNGGGSSTSGAGGGGGTDIRIKPRYNATPDTVDNDGNVTYTYDSLYARVIVAGGGGGAGQYSCAPGTSSYGGGSSGGGSASQDSCGTSAGGGTQVSGGAAGIYSSTYGVVGAYGVGATSLDSTYDGGGGGGGWYGGGAGTSSSYANAGGGGSGWVYTESSYQTWASASDEGTSGNWLLTSDYYLTNAATIAGNATFVSPGGGSETGHQGNGYALVTYCGAKESDCS